MYVHACGVQRITVDMFLKHCLPFICNRVSHWSEEASWLAFKLQASACLLSFQCWDYKQSPQFLTFLYVVEMELGPWSCMGNILRIKLLPYHTPPHHTPPHPDLMLNFTPRAGLCCRSIVRKQLHILFSRHTLALGVENGCCFALHFSLASPPGGQLQLGKQGCVVWYREGWQSSHYPERGSLWG